MPNATAGIAAIGVYNGGTAHACVDQLTALIPNPDNPASSSTGAVAGGGFLDEMSPMAAIQLLVELAALRAAIVALGD